MKPARKELTFRDLTPRADIVSKLERKRERFARRLKETKYESTSDMFDDVVIWEGIQKEIEIQECYMQMEEKYWNS